MTTTSTSSELLLPGATAMDAVTLHVADLPGMTVYYRDALGLAELDGAAARTAVDLATPGAAGAQHAVLGRGTTALVSLTGETLVLALPALAALVVLEAAGRGTFTTDGPVHTALLVSAGLVTMAPLLLFGAAARRVPLSTIGLLQYLTPVLQLLLGVLVLGETVAPTRWVGFGLIWLALVLLTVDTLRSARRQALVRAAEASAKG